MVTVTIRGVPADTRQQLADEARLQGQSLQAFLLGVLNREAAFHRNRQLLDEIEHELAEEDAGPTADEIVEVIRQGREERTAHIIDAVLGLRDRARDDP